MPAAQRAPLSDYTPQERKAENGGLERPAWQSERSLAWLTQQACPLFSCLLPAVAQGFCLFALFPIHPRQLNQHCKDLKEEARSL